ncbi:class I SAM-dependent methyltransferase [Aeromicrobium sp. CTD01-1L150]|uniref:class I SAM-dependent methyltransferase n=1 Tax=Aeromicrobium sp. CTD01-1L150 TaxID=3341830 RepID=UPI0035BF9553
MTCDCCGSAEWVPLFSENGLRLGRCPDCALLYVDDIPDPTARMTEMEEGHYAGTQQINEAVKQSAGEVIQRDRFQAFVDLARRHRGDGRWLDVGCGGGLLLSLARDAGYDVEGIELSADRRALTEEATGATVHGVPLEDVGYPDDAFDVVSLINVFSHLVSPARTFAELRRLLRPGGIVVMATGEFTAGVSKGDMLAWNLGDHLYFLGDGTIERYAAASGLRLIDHERRWLPDEMFSREWLRVKGRSGPKNALKTIIDRTPGGLRLLRAVMLRRQADSSAHSGTFVLTPAA